MLEFTQGLLAWETRIASEKLKLLSAGRRYASGSCELLQTLSRSEEFQIAKSFAFIRDLVTAGKELRSSGWPHAAADSFGGVCAALAARELTYSRQRSSAASGVNVPTTRNMSTTRSNII
jgi:hypothetical protein